MDDNKTVRVTVQPEVSQELSNATKLKNMMRAELRRIQKTDNEKYQSRVK